MLRVTFEGLGAEARGVERWTLARPEAANAIDGATADALEAAIAAVEARALESAAPRVILLDALPRSDGKRSVFCAGADLRQLSTIDDPRPFSAAMTARLARLSSLPAVVIAAVAGDVFGGGCELLSACDLVVIERGASLAFRQARMGLSTGWGGMTRLAARIGIGACKRLLLTGEPCDADEALRLGLVDRVVEEGRALEDARAWAASIALGGRRSVTLLKRAIDETYASTDPVDARYAREIDRFVAAWSTGEHRDALAALSSRRGR